MTAVETGVPQHMQALADANEIRLRRASLHRQCRRLGLPEAREMIADMLASVEPAIQSMVAADLLTWPKRGQRPQAEQMLSRCGVRSLARRVGELTARQVALLVTLLRQAAAAGRADRERRAR